MNINEQKIVTGTTNNAKALMYSMQYLSDISGLIDGDLLQYRRTILHKFFFLNVYLAQQTLCMERTQTHYLQREKNN